MEQAPTPNSRPEEPGPSEAESIETLERELDLARTELAEYQALIDELPAIYEAKFRHQVQGLAQDIKRLLDERRALQSQLDGALPSAPPDRPALPPVVLEPVEGGLPPAEEPRSRRPASLRLRRWQRGMGRSWHRVRDGALQRSRALRSSVSPRLRLPLVAVVSAFGVAALVIGVEGLRRQGAAPTTGTAPRTVTPATQQPAPPRRQDQDLTLRSRGTAWLEVQTLEGEVVYFDTLKKGEQQRIPLQEGLKVRAGRPDLLDVAIDDGPYEVLNPIHVLGWRTFMPELEPGVPPSPAPSSPMLPSPGTPTPGTPPQP
ncbi:hypothetical protein CPCC7001_470 [Cyanobium sp. PCC 7001]|uniref:DUF4115 domain-containing protein n=1 Tax=Cyanobium sp. PCC 7001 TaxID=180281 RepID=UPI00018051A6|nr:DUF4115 domain-containing protein [Cyanobium sp. PCC 7001]EDY37591.1 hypothetical protein CPCC7001_470 [Cyanobium sp. PCC 7001]